MKKRKKCSEDGKTGLLDGILLDGILLDGILPRD